MKTEVNRNSTPGGKPPDGPTDGLALWDAEAARAPARLAPVRLDSNERLLLPFTTAMTRLPLHFLDFPMYRGYVRCNEPDCVLCQSGRQKEQRDLLPIYDVVERLVGVLP